MSLELTIDEADAGARLDVLLVRRVDGMSRARARRLIAEGAVHVNGRRARKGARLCAGDHVRLDALPAPADFPARADADAALVVRIEDPYLVIADKPAGVPTHPLRPDETRTLAGALLSRYPEMAGVGHALREPGILHRLDNDTSGLVLAARTQAAFDALRELLREGRIDKRYEALVAGSIEPGTIDAPIAPHPSDPRRVHPCLDPGDRRRSKARPARTEILRARAVGASFALLELRAPVAARHQIRAHLAALGHPLAGDWLYGGPKIEGLTRHFLHASRMRFDHPFEAVVVDVGSPTPPELASLVGSLERDE